MAGNALRAQQEPYAQDALLAEDVESLVNEGPQLSPSAPCKALQFSPSTVRWEISSPASSSQGDQRSLRTREQFSISSYNVLIDSHHPITTERFTLVADAILSSEAAADVLLLQEVSDDFLSRLLALDAVRERYPFVSHGPPDQEGISSLTSIRNIVALSRWDFTWHWLPFRRRHKGAVVVSIPEIYCREGDTTYPLMIASVHLTCGLTDGSVAAKKSQLHTLLSHLHRYYPSNPWIIAGDFNITTSSFTIGQALKTRSISAQTAATLSSLDDMLWDAHLRDTYFLAPTDSISVGRVRLAHAAMDELYEGEQGATFDPLHNEIAAAIVGSGLNNRPQRYDRILFKDAGILRVRLFSMFGLPETIEESTLARISGQLAPIEGYGSDHWGIRATFDVSLNSDAPPDSPDVSRLSLKPSLSSMPPLSTTGTVGSLGDGDQLVNCLQQNELCLTPDDQSKRVEAYILLKNVLNQTLTSDDPNALQGRPVVKFQVEMVGSGALGTADALSDIDILCLGVVSSRVFFSLAIGRLRRAKDRVLDVNILRKVDATTGTMLELLVRGTRVDLHYCPATRLLEQWPKSLYLPPTHSSYLLPRQTLEKLQPLRDAMYLKQTIPDMATFRTVVNFLKAWARGCGIYNAKFGYLGGVHITLMLSAVYKMLHWERGHHVSVGELLGTFFTYYSTFDWDKHMVCDPDMVDQTRYHRSLHEPMAILTIHAPKKNVARSVTAATRKAIEFEICRAAAAIAASKDPSSWLSYRTQELSSQMAARWLILPRHGDVPTWADFLDDPDYPDSVRATGVTRFLRANTAFVQINVRYWGGSMAEGGKLLGWLESRLATVSFDLSKAIAPYYCQIWPGRFSPAPLEETSSYFGCYLLAIHPEGTGPSLSATGKIDGDALKTALRKFTDQIQQNEHFNHSVCWIDTSLVPRKDLNELVLDTRNWGVSAEEDAFIDDEFDAEEGQASEGDPSGDGPNDPIDASVAHPSWDPLTTDRATSGLSGSPQTALRTSADVLNRILWDESMDTDDYIIGYEDRFVGVKEMPVRRWKRNTTDEEFIPLHRVVYFRRRSDGARVWDKANRTDLVFSSGATAGPHRVSEKA